MQIAPKVKPLLNIRYLTYENVHFLTISSFNHVNYCLIEVYLKIIIHQRYQDSVTQHGKPSQI